MEDEQEFQRSSKMADKSNILAGLAMATNQQQANKENQQHRKMISTDGTARPTGGAAGGRQHKLKQRFTVIRKLGKGTYGKVQLAINKETGQEVAIKTIKKTKIENEQDLQRVRREIQIMSSIEHPHIIHIYEVFENKDKIVLVMQYAPGGELYEYVSQSKVLDDSEARRLFRQIATAIYYCHQNKICHRDLKLENILLDEKNNAKLADFGLSNVFDKSRQLQTFCGSPLYASPEIVQGSPYEGPEVDCWSLGVLLYTLVYGAMPFDGSNFKRLVKQISEACYFEPKQRSQASPLIRRLLCADPLKRANVSDICADPWVNGQSIVPPGSPLNELPLQQQNQVYPSLVQVAQDMANLTPVRLDLLLALAPQLSPVIPGQKAESRPALAKRTDNAARRSPVHLEPALMELEEGRASSPVASYIVRNLDEQQAGDEPPEPAEEEMEVMDHMEEEEQSDRPQDRAESTELSVTTEPQQVQVSSEQVEPAEQQVVEHSMSISSCDANQSRPGDPPAAQDEPEPVREVEQASTAEIELPIAMEVEERPELECQPPDSDKQVDQHSVKAAPQEVSEPVDEPAEATQAERAEPTPIDESSSLAANEPASGEAEAQQTEVDSEKPKKVKKKIVVVRKRKKVTKKEVGTDSETAESKDKSKSDKEEEAAPTADSASTEKPKATKPKGPGKVRIPNTFQAPVDGATAQTPVKQTPPEGRRQSVLVAEVSQKLLQQLQEQTSGSDQVPVQLPGARVSDKKSEFERRASLAVGVAAGGSPQSGVTVSQSGPIPAESLRESLSILDEILQTLVEPVEKQEPLEVSLLRPPENLSDGDPLTPTGDSPMHLARGEQSQLEQKLEEYADQNGSKRNDGPKSTATGDERSDSVETIKAEELIVEEPTKIRSSLLIDLAPRSIGDEMTTTSARPSRDSAGSLGSQVAIGPAPITRSYKKVTFTRDGACITETGKIYATQRDDGSVRRVERKSKITHYPATGDGNQGSAQRIQEQEETEEEQVVFGGDDGERFWKESHHQRQQQHSSFSSNSRQQVTGRPFEKLIMPSTGMLSDRDDDFRRHSLFSRQSGPLGRADSGSSCSSSSTDVFDDIFDTWTGAISMFNRNHQASGGSSRAGGLLSRAFEELASISPATSLFGGRKSSRHRGVSSSLAGTPRCESVEPPAQRGRDRADSASQRRWAGDATSGYESDSRERPASAMGNPRRERLFAPLRRPHLSDAEPLFPFGGSDERDPLSTSGFGSAFGRGDQLLRSIEQEQESLKQRLAREHRHIWKGSTPSLFQEDEQEVWQRDTRQQVFSQKQQYDGGRPRATTNVQATQGTATTEQVLNQSQSSSSFLRQSVALDSAPQRKRPGEGADNLPPQPVRKSLSKTSVITSKLANVQLTSGAEKQQQQQQSSASFIELKRTSSSSSNHRQLDKSQQLQHQQHQVQQQLVSTNSRLISTASGSSSAFWEGRITPLSSATSEALARQQPDTPKEHSPSVREQAKARVQDWLQESTGNMSSLSGSHSSASASASDSLNAGSRVDPFANLYGSLQSRREVAASLQSRQHSASLLPPIPGPVRSTSRGSHTSETSAAKQQVKSVVVSSSSTSRRSATIEGGANVEKQQQQERQHIIQREESGSDQVKQVSSSSSNKVTSTSFSLRLDSPNQSEMKQVLQKVSTTSTQSASVTGRNTEGLIWPRAEVAIDNSQMLNEEQDNSNSGPGSAELDSTSSLLDQLRSRGYRSMINQRMVSQPPVEQQVSSTKAAVKTESCSRVVSSSTSSTVSGSTRLVQQKQVFTSNTLESTSSASNLDQQELPPESSSTANIVNTSAQKLEEPLAAAQVETIEQVADETKQSDDLTHSKQNKDVEEEEMDEDVREAKANIKGYLDSVKETENFLRSLQQEEEQLERHRQQLYLFNNLMLSSKLNGINRNGFNNGSGQTTSGLIDELNFAPSTTHNGGTLSAPVRSSYKLSFMAEPVTTNGFIPSAALSFEPTYTIPTSSAPSVAGQYIPRASQRPLEPLRFGTAVEHDSVTGTSTHTPSYLDWRTSSLYPATPSGTTSQVDPLEPVQALNLQHRAPLAAGRPSFALVGSDRTNESRFRRSQSQLGDQFTDYKRRARPLSANLDSIGLDSNPYFPSSAKRASSQLRYSNNHHSSRYNPPAVSEYRSAYSGGLTTGEPRLPSPRAVSPAGETLNVGTDDDDDDGMSAYRATNYVPRVVPLERGRTPARRSLSRQPEWQPNDGSRPGYGRERRTSLQPPATTSTGSEITFSSNLLDAKRDVSPAPTTTRRSSLGEFTGSTPDAAGGNTRLSQLEFRIEQNRKRREQLLSGRLSPQPQREDESKPEAQPQRSRELSPVQQRGSTSSSTGGLKLNRPSRLESMEARIKRRSYCVRMANRSPERSHLRSQQSLEKWRPSSTLTDSSSPKNSGATPESGSLFQISSDKKQSAAGSSTNGLDGLDQSTC